MIIVINYKLHKITIVTTLIFILYNIYSYSKRNELM